MDFKFDEYGNIIKNEYVTGNEEIMQRVLHIIRSYKGELPDTASHGNPNRLNESFDPDIDIQVYLSELNDTLFEDPLVNGYCYLGYNTTVKGAQTFIIYKSDTDEPLTEYTFTTLGKLYYNRPVEKITAHSLVDKNITSDKDGELTIQNVTFTNKKLITINEIGGAPQDIKKIEKQIVLDGGLDIQRMIEDEIQDTNFAILSVTLYDQECSYVITEGSLLLIPNYKSIDTIAFLKIEYLLLSAEQEIILYHFHEENSEYAYPVDLSGFYSCTIYSPIVKSNRKYNVKSGSFTYVIS